MTLYGFSMVLMLNTLKSISEDPYLALPCMSNVFCLQSKNGDRHLECLRAQDLIFVLNFHEVFGYIMQPLMFTATQRYI